MNEENNSVDRSIKIVHCLSCLDNKQYDKTRGLQEHIIAHLETVNNMIKLETWACHSSHEDSKHHDKTRDLHELVIAHMKTVNTMIKLEAYMSLS